MPHFGARFGRLTKAKREDLGWNYAPTALAVYGNDGQGGETRSEARARQNKKTKHSHVETIPRRPWSISGEIDACKTDADFVLERYADQLFDTIKATVAQVQYIPDELVQALSETYAAGNPNDFDTALRELTNAIQHAATDRARGLLPSNVDAAVAALIARMDALKTLGERENGTKRLDQAVTAYKNARLKYTRERVPLDWAMLQGNRCYLELAFFDKLQDTDHLQRASEHLAQAREVFEKAGTSQYLRMTDELGQMIAARWAGDI